AGLGCLALTRAVARVRALSATGALGSLRGTTRAALAAGPRLRTQTCPADVRRTLHAPLRKWTLRFRPRPGPA
ncbi:MAG TPA: hypothetical protein VEI82_01125, partial [Myxococcota bacterium]|nr:hypothetical protein [Myxococcota bacterium]